MGGRQKGKKIVDNSEDRQTETVGTASQEEFMPRGIKRLLGLTFDGLLQIGVSDSRVLKMPTRAKELVMGKFNVRTEHSGYTQKLLQSMKEIGQQKPIIVTPRDSKLWVVSGNTRLEAARTKGSGVGDVSVLIVPMTDEDAWILALKANIDNSLPVTQLTEMEEARAMEKLIVGFNWTQQRVAEEIHRDQTLVSRRLRFLKVDPSLDAMLKNEELTPSHIEVLVSLPRGLQNWVAQEVVNPDNQEERLSVKGTQNLVSAVKAVLDDNQDFDETLQENIVDVLAEKKWDAETAAQIGKVVKSIWPSLKTLPDHLREDLVQEIVARNYSLEIGQQIRHAIASALGAGASEWDLSDIFEKDWSAPPETPKEPEVTREEITTEQTTSEAEVGVTEAPPANAPGISEQLFGKHISGEAPSAATSTEDLKTADNLDSIAAETAKQYDESYAKLPVDAATNPAIPVTKSSEHYLKFPCPRCGHPIVVDTDDLQAKWDIDSPRDKAEDDQEAA